MLYSLKKFVSFFLATVFLISCIQISFATDGASVSAGTVSGKPGDTVSVDLSIAGNTGFTSFTLDLGYNASSLTFDSASSSLAGQLVPTSQDGQTHLTFTATASDTNITSNGVICTVKFKINSTAEIGDTALSLSGSAKDKDNASLALSFTNGKVTVQSAAHSVTVQSGENGTASSDKTSYATGDTVTLTATPAEGYQFKTWSTESTDVTFLSSATSKNATFTMPNHDVVISAAFESQSATYTVSIVSSPVAGGTAATTPTTYHAGDTVTVTATPNSGYVFDNWSGPTGVNFVNSTNNSTTFVMPASNVSITANFVSSSVPRYTVTINTNGSGGTAKCYKASFAAGEDVRITATPYTNYSFDRWSTTGSADFDDELDSETFFKMPAVNVTITANFKSFVGHKVTILIDGGGNATTDKDGYSDGEKVVIVASPSTGYYFYGWSATSSEEVKFLNASYYSTSFIMPDHDVKIRALFAKSAATSTSVVGGTNVTQTSATFMFSFDSMGGSTVNPLSATGGYTATKPVDPTKKGYVFGGWYTDTTCTTPYDFSSAVYSNMVVYAKWTQVSTVFTDVKNSDWFYEPVSELYSKKIIGGMGDKLFMPKSNITRAQFCQILAKLSGSDLSAYTSSSFSDIKSTDWCMKSVAWANEKGIVKGLGNGLFSPSAPISRQDMAVMISRFAQAIKNYTFPTTSNVTAFADINQISEYAKSAVANMQQSKIISGTPDNKFNPKANASRAEACKMIYELMKLFNA